MRREAAVLVCVMVSGCDHWPWQKKSKDRDCERVTEASELVLGGKCYEVSGAIAIGDGENVALGEGTELRFGRGASLRVGRGGSFSAFGSAARPVKLGASGCGWGGVVYEAGSAGSLQGVVISNAGVAEDAGEDCSCGSAASACLTVEQGAQVALSQVALEECAGNGVDGQPLSATQVGCKQIGLCDPDATCADGGEGDLNAWCPDDEDLVACWDPALADAGPDECESSDGRCEEDRYVQACVGGKWMTITDCSENTSGQTACRDFDGFPRCGMPGPTACLHLPETPGGSFIPNCETEGCPAYEAACRGDAQPAGPVDGHDVAGCLHPNTLAGLAGFQGLGPEWIRLVIYNWGGTPDTTQGSVSFTLDGAGYGLRVWLPPNAANKREFGALYAAVDAGGSRAVPMPPPGKEYEVLLEVTSSKGSGWAGEVLYPQVVPSIWDDVVLWRTYSPDHFFPRCEIQDAVLSASRQGMSTIDDFLTGACINSLGAMVDGQTGAPADGYPNLGTYPQHADPALSDCDTWQVAIEYIDMEAK